MLLYFSVNVLCRSVTKAANYVCELAWLIMRVWMLRSLSSVDLLAEVLIGLTVD